MNHTRIQVPLTLSEPHFEDEATVVSARRVVPLEQVRGAARWRRPLTLLPIFLAATLCGALGAIAVNYFERQPIVSPAVSQPAVIETQTAQAPAAPSPVVIVPSSPDGIAGSGEAEAGAPNKSDESDSTSADKTPEPATVPQTIPAKASEADSPRKTNQSDPKELVRPRRVRPQASNRASQNDAPKSSGAGRIQDLFGGPNP